MTKVTVFAFLLLMTGAASAQERDLQLSTRILKQSYCLDRSAATTMLLLSLELTYTNVGDNRLILYKGSNQISYVRAALSEKDLTIGKYEVDMSTTWVSSGSGEVSDVGSVPDSRFAILKPGGSFKIVGETRIIDSDKVLVAGEHVLQVVTSTWEGSSEQARKLRNRWLRTGDFWYANTSSLPMRFRVEQSPKLKKCS